MPVQAYFGRSPAKERGLKQNGEMKQNFSSVPISRKAWMALQTKRYYGKHQ